MIYLGSNFVGPCLLCVRAAIILDWVRIFVPAGTRNALFWTSHVLLCVVITFYIALIFAENLSCIPREKIWNPLVPGGRCISQQALITAASSINLVADLTILVLPQMVIWKLHMSTSKKIGLSIIFAIALLYANKPPSPPRAPTKMSPLLIWWFGDQKRGRRGDSHRHKRRLPEYHRLGLPGRDRHPSRVRRAHASLHRRLRAVDSQDVRVPA